MPNKGAASQAGDPAQNSSQTQHRAFGTPHAGSPTRLAMLIASRMTGARRRYGITGRLDEGESAMPRRKLREAHGENSGDG